MISHSLNETEKIAEDFLSKIAKIKKDRALVVGLFGDLGSGKTAFTQALARQLEVKETVTSPTFVIMKKYEVSSIQYPVSNTKYPILNTQYSTLIHIDAYRLEKEKEILNLNFAEDLADPKNLIIIEWPERIAGALPKDLLRINFEFISENERKIEWI